MRENYPSNTTVPAKCVVPPELQPEFLEPDGIEVAEFANIGVRLSADQLKEGHASTMAVLEAETGRSYTYAELDAESWRLAASLISLGLQAGDRVALRSPNVPEFLVVALATWKAGGVLVPTPVQARPAELRFFLDDTSARFLVVYGRHDLTRDIAEALDGGTVEQVISFGVNDGELGIWWGDLAPGEAELAHRRAASVHSHAVAVIWHTGGTSGQPKACYQSHRRLILGAELMGQTTGVEPGERRMAAAPVGHAFGFTFHSAWSLAHGATVVLVENFGDADRLLSAIEAERVGTFAAITITWARLLDAIERRRANGDPVDLSSLRRGYAMWQTTSSSDVYASWLAHGVELLNNFGTTAFSAWVLAPEPQGGVPRATLGKPASGHEVVAISMDDDGRTLLPVGAGEAGRMAVRGPSGLTYWNRPELQRRDVVDGWTLVDDLIQFDADGYAHYLGRTDFLISTAGYKVAPGEVEEILSTHASVREVGVVGVPDALRQEAVAAFVALNDGAEPSRQLAEELQELVKQRLSPYKYPRHIEFIEALPRDPVGKVQPLVLKEWAAEKAAAGS